MKNTWEVVGDGAQGPDCGLPVPICVRDEDPKRPDTHEAIMIWGEHVCTDSQCPICCDRGYVAFTVGRELREVQAQLRASVRTGKFRAKVNGQWRRLKVYHAIISLEAGDSIEDAAQLTRRRHRAIAIAKDHGFVWGLMVAHPYRGPQGSTGEERRANLERDAQSLHFHVIGLAFWIRPNEAGSDYVIKVPDKRDKDGSGIRGVLGTVGRTSASLRSLWGRTSAALRYELDHAGRFDHGQFVVRFGKRSPITSRDIRPSPEVTYEIRDESRSFYPGPISPGYECDAYQQRWISGVLKYYGKKRLKIADGERKLGYITYKYPSEHVNQLLDDEFGIEWDMILIDLVEKTNPYRSAAR